MSKERINEEGDGGFFKYQTSIGEIVLKRVGFAGGVITYTVYYKNENRGIFNILSFDILSFDILSEKDSPHTRIARVKGLISELRED